MIAVDSNILVYAHRKDSPFYGAASKRLAELAEGTATWAIPWPCVLEQIEAWLESPTLTLLAEPAGYWATLRAQLTEGHIAGGRVHDARVAALCLEHSVRELWSADRDFSRFRGLNVVNPLLRH
jgi:uncharacterized protein